MKRWGSERRLCQSWCSPLSKKTPRPHLRPPPRRKTPRRSLRRRFTRDTMKHDFARQTRAKIRFDGQGSRIYACAGSVTEHDDLQDKSNCQGRRSTAKRPMNSISNPGRNNKRITKPAQATGFPIWPTAASAAKPHLSANSARTLRPHVAPGRSMTEVPFERRLQEPYRRRRATTAS